MKDNELDAVIDARRRSLREVLPSEQVGGDHYAKMGIDVFEFAMVNGLDMLQASVVKYVCRFRDKNGIEDLRKAAHCLNRLIEFETRKQNGHD